MAILKKLFSSGAKELVESVGSAIDKIHTSAEEKELIKAEVKAKILDFEIVNLFGFFLGITAS